MGHRIGSTIGVAITTLVMVLTFSAYSSVGATAGINQEISFEGKVVTAAGVNIPDGTYNMEFKIYTAAGSCNPSTGVGCTLGWTEDWLNQAGHGVTFTGGTFQVNLDDVAQNNFSGIDFNSFPLYLSLTMGSTNGSCTPFSSCTPDSEMKPYIKLTATPYALNANALQGLAASAFGQLTANQTFTGANTFQPATNINGLTVKQTLAGSPTADIFDVQSANNSSIIQITGPSANNAAVNITSLGANSITLQSGSGTVSLGSSTTLSSTGSLTVQAGGTNTLALNTAGAGTVNVGTSNTTTVGIGSTGAALTVESSSTANLFNGNTAHTIQIAAGGTSATQSITIGSSGSTSSALTLNAGSSGGVTVNGSTTVASGSNFTTTAGTTTLSGATGGNGNAVKINSNAATNIGLQIQGASSQSAKLLQLLDNTGANLYSIDSVGSAEQLGYYNTPFGGFGAYGNLILQSEAFDNASWTKISINAVTPNNVVAPDGNTTAESLADSAPGGSAAQSSATAITASATTYTFSVWLQTASGTQSVDLRIDGSTGGTGTKKTVTATATWQRFDVSQAVSTGVGFSGNVKVSIFPGGTAGSGTVRAWGAQLVVGSVDTVYAKTVGSVVAATNGLVVGNAALLQSSNNSTVAFQVEDSSANSVFGVDTSGGIVNLGGNLTFTGTTARTITGPGAGGLTISDATGAVNITGGAASTFDIGNNTLSIQTTNNGAITTGSGLLTLGGNVTFSGTTARSITGPGTGALTVTAGSGAALTLTGNAASTFSTSSGALTITSATAAVWSTSAGTLTVQSASGNAFTASAQGAGQSNFGTVGTGVTVLGNTTGNTNLQGPTYTTSDSGVFVGTGGTTTDPILLGLSNATSTGAETTNTCSTTVNSGALYYSASTASNSTTTNELRGCINGKWTDVVTADQLGIMLFGVEESSGVTTGDITGITGYTNAPCKVTWATATSVSVAPCTAYSGGRKVVITAAVSITGLGTGGSATFQHICLIGTNGAPQATAANTSETAAVPAFSASAPILCLATVKLNTTPALTNIYDTRVFVTSTKEYATSSTAVAPGMAVVQDTSADNLVHTVSTGTANTRGVVAVGSATGSTTTVNVIMVVGGPVFIKATGTVTLGRIAQTTTTAGYVSGVTLANGGGFKDFGQILGNGNTAGCSAATNCQFSIFTDLITY